MCSFRYPVAARAGHGELTPTGYTEAASNAVYVGATALAIAAVIGTFLPSRARAATAAAAQATAMARESAGTEADAEAEAEATTEPPKLEPARVPLS